MNENSRRNPFNHYVHQNMPKREAWPNCRTENYLGNRFRDSVHENIPKRQVRTNYGTENSSGNRDNHFTHQNVLNKATWKINRKENTFENYSNSSCNQNRIMRQSQTDCLNKVPPRTNFNNFSHKNMTTKPILNDRRSYANNSFFKKIVVREAQEDRLSKFTPKNNSHNFPRENIVTRQAENYCGNEIPHRNHSNDFPRQNIAIREDLNYHATSRNSFKNHVGNLSYRDRMKSDAQNDGIEHRSREHSNNFSRQSMNLREVQDDYKEGKSRPHSDNFHHQNNVQNKLKTKQQKHGEAQNDYKNPKTKVPSEYAGIPAALLFCYLCRRGIEDLPSFEDHLNSKPHKVMLDIVHQSNIKKAEVLRLEAKGFELQRHMTLYSSLRNPKENLCTMCEVEYIGSYDSHINSEWHQRLKNFLRPACVVCSMVFDNRKEFYQHNVSVHHLMKLNEVRKKFCSDLDDNNLCILDFIDNIIGEIEAGEIDIKVASRIGVIEKEGLLMKDGDGNSPKYDPGIPIGSDAVVERKAYYCKICNRFTLCQEDATVHCRSLFHFHRFKQWWEVQSEIRKPIDKKTRKCDGIYDHSAKEDSVPKRQKLSVLKTNKTPLKTTRKSQRLSNRVQDPNTTEKTIESRTTRIHASTEVETIIAEVIEIDDDNSEVERVNEPSVTQMVAEPDSEHELIEDEDGNAVEKTLLQPNIILECIADDDDQLKPVRIAEVGPEKSPPKREQRARRGRRF